MDFERKVELERRKIETINFLKTLIAILEKSTVFSGMYKLHNETYDNFHKVPTGIVEAVIKIRFMPNTEKESISFGSNNNKRIKRRKRFLERRRKNKKQVTKSKNLEVGDLFKFDFEEMKKHNMATIGEKGMIYEVKEIRKIKEVEGRIIGYGKGYGNFQGSPVYYHVNECWCIKVEKGDE